MQRMFRADYPDCETAAIQEIIAVTDLPSASPYPVKWVQYAVQKLYPNHLSEPSCRDQ
jgi:hypothetical protein